MTVPADLFFGLFLSTVVVTRLWLWCLPMPGPTFLGVRIHHYIFGLALIATAVGIQSLFLFAVGFGLFVDEATYLLIRGRTHADNYSIPSLGGTAVLVVFVYFCRGALSALVA